MADEAKKADDETTSEEEAPPKSKKPMIIGGGLVGLIAAAYIVSMVALPGDSEPPPFDGPFSEIISTEAIQVNIGGKDYLSMQEPAIKFDAYTQAYGTKRLLEQVVMRDITDVLQRLGRQKTKKVIDTQIGEDVFRQEIIENLSPIIFPVHVGNMERADRPHMESGIGPGHSIDRSTMRGGFESHVIHINTYKGEISLDEGPVVLYDSSAEDSEIIKSDLMLESAEGMVVYVDVTELKAEYVGDIKVGTFGVIKKITFKQLLTQ